MGSSDIAIENLPPDYREAAEGILREWNSARSSDAQEITPEIVSSTMDPFGDQDTRYITKDDYEALKNSAAFGDPFAPRVNADEFLNFAEYLRRQTGYHLLPPVRRDNSRNSPARMAFVDKNKLGMSEKKVPHQSLANKKDDQQDELDEISNGTNPLIDAEPTEKEILEVQRLTRVALERNSNVMEDEELLAYIEERCREALEVGNVPYAAMFRLMFHVSQTLGWSIETFEELLLFYNDDSNPHSACNMPLTSNSN